MDSADHKIIAHILESVCDEVCLSLLHNSEEKLYYKTLQEVACYENSSSNVTDNTSTFSNNDQLHLEPNLHNSFSEFTSTSEFSYASTGVSYETHSKIPDCNLVSDAINKRVEKPDFTQLDETASLRVSTSEHNMDLSNNNVNITVVCERESKGAGSSYCSTNLPVAPKNLNIAVSNESSRPIDQNSIHTSESIYLSHEQSNDLTESMDVSTCNIDTFNLKLLSHELIAETSNFENGNFLKGCSWAPDGLCFLSNTNDKFVRIFNTPYQCLNVENVNIEAPINLETCVKVKEPGTVYDYCWWPLMNSSEPVTCCFATTASNQPIHLWDAFDGKLRASYIALNSVNEVASAYSLCFSNDGRQLLCGFKKDVCLFYTDRPGAHFERWTTAKKKQRKSQNNIISCMEFCPDNTMFACGAYDGTIGLYSPVNGHLLDFTAAHQTGVTWLKFSRDGYRLYSGVRHGSSLKAWDIRNLQRAVGSMHRQVSTNQRIYFDILHDRANQNDLCLVSGSTDGSVYFFDLAAAVKAADNVDTYNWQTNSLEPFYSFKAYNDCCNGCSIHPFLSLMLTTSGQRNYVELCDSDDETNCIFRKTRTEENKIKIWRLISKTF